MKSAYLLGPTDRTLYRAAALSDEKLGVMRKEIFQIKKNPTHVDVLKSLWEGLGRKEKVKRKIERVESKTFREEKENQVEIHMEKEAPLSKSGVSIFHLSERIQVLNSKLQSENLLHA